MNIILFEKDEINQSVPQQIIVTDHRAKHIVKVLRSAVGDRLKVGIIDGAKGDAIVRSITVKYPFAVTLELQFAETARENEPVIDLILALPRPIMLRRIFSQATSLGIGTFHIIQANRVEKSFWEASLLEVEEYRQHLIAGLEQAVATRLPKVQFHHKFKPFIEDFFPTISSNYSAKIIADPGGDTSLPKALHNISSQVMSSVLVNKVLLCVGPEGGWVDYELEKFVAAGCRRCTIGPRILKVDTAVVALHSRITALLEVQKL